MKKKVLIVEDSKDVGEALRMLIELEGYDAALAASGGEARAMATSVRPDLILMDVVMPGQNGFQLTRAITRDPRFESVPVIMCTSKNQETDKVWGMRQGARDYIVKPVDADELVKKIKAFD